MKKLEIQSLALFEMYFIKWCFELHIPYLPVYNANLFFPK